MLFASCNNPSLDSSEQLLLAGRLEDVRGGELEELDSEAGPLLGPVGDQEELVALVHRDHALDVLLLDLESFVINSELRACSLILSQQYY